MTYFRSVCVMGMTDCALCASLDKIPYRPSICHFWTLPHFLFDKTPIILCRRHGISVSFACLLLFSLAATDSVICDADITSLKRF